MTKARSTVVREGTECTYHCVSRCVRRAFLCGFDSLSGKNFDHRKEWIRFRIKHLAKIFAMDVCGYAVMSNHLHLVLRTRPDLSESWSDEEVAFRWRTLYPRRRDPSTGLYLEPNEAEILAITGDPDLTKKYRHRLQSISWFMGRLNEWLARKANHEDGCKGRFWEGRFNSTALLDEAAILSCCIYVDLNPVRAGVANSPEESDFTSGQDRIRARQAKQFISKIAPDSESRGRAMLKTRFSELHTQRNSDNWLCPLRDSAYRKGFLNLDLEDYLRLLDWSGRQIKHNKTGSIPTELDRILVRLEVEQSIWLETVQRFGDWFPSVAGGIKVMTHAAANAGLKWFKGQNSSRKAFKSG